MKSYFSSLACIIIFTMVAGNAFSISAAGSRPHELEDSQNSDQMSQEELQAAVISFADRFIATIGQAAFDLEAKIPTKEGRLIAAARKVYSLSAATEIAAGPNPGAAMLDLVVMTTLNRLVWEEYWQPQIFGMPATIMVDAFKKMEKDVWSLAAKVMTPEQMEELYDLIMAWYADNPTQRAVDYIRFSDFGDLGKKPNLKQIQKPGGLLAPVREATEAVDEVRMTSERAMFLLTKMQIIMGFQAELIFKQVVLQPEMVTLLKDISGFRMAADRFAGLVEKIPEQLADEREATFSDAGKLIARERTAVLEAFDAKTQTIRQINTDVQKTLDRIDPIFITLQKTITDAERLAKSTEQATTTMKDLVLAVDRLAVRFETNGPEEHSKTFDINEYITAIEKVQATLDSLSQMSQPLNDTNTPLITLMIEGFNEAADQRVDHIFTRLFQLILAAFVMVIVVLVLIRITQKKPAMKS